MDTKTIAIIVIIIGVILALWYFSKNKLSSSNKIFYKVQFISDWGNNRQEINAPSNPHTGNMFLISHNEKINLFKVGSYAPKGISNTSMYGTIDDLLAAFDRDRNHDGIARAPVLMTPGQQSLMISADEKFHYLSFVTMVAPSPDWFTGISGLNLIENGQWIRNKTIPLYVYDAGTDSGTAFNTEHYIREQPLPITLKNDTFLYPDGKLKPIAYLNITMV
jgi:hypothetical protein